MTCNHCGGVTTPAEVAAYKGRCEDCYTDPARTVGHSSSMPPSTQRVGNGRAGRHKKKPSE